MKIVFKFTSDKTITEEVKKTSIDTEGKEVTILEKGEKKVPYNFAIAKPTNSLRRQAEAFMAISYSESLKAGILTRAQLNKRITNDEGLNGILSKYDLEEFEKSRQRLLKNQEEYQVILSTNEIERTDEQKKKLEELRDNIYTELRKLRSYESAIESQYNNTAEYLSYGKLVVWWTLNLSYQINDKGEFSPFFTGKDYNERLAKYDELLEGEDEFIKGVIRDLTFIVTFWANGASETEDDFNRVLEEARKSPV